MLDKDKTLVSIDDAQLHLGNIGRTMLYKLMKEGDLTAVKIGRRSLITRASIDAYVTRLTEESRAEK